MSFLKRFFRNVLDEGSLPVDQRSSFEHLTDEELEAHLGVAKYGDFLLTEAVRPSYDLQVVPKQGYKHDVYQDDDSTVPVIMASASRETLFDLFMELIEPLGNEVDVVLETSHSHTDGHQDLYREHIDIPILQSVLWDFEDLLLNDGCTGIAVLNPAVPQEVQFDEHKMLIVYGEPLHKFEHILRRHDIPYDESMKFITEAEHVHSSSDTYSDQFQQLKTRLGIDSVFDEASASEF